MKGIARPKSWLTHPSPLPLTLSKSQKPGVGEAKDWARRAWLGELQGGQLPKMERTPRDQDNVRQRDEKAAPPQDCGGTGALCIPNPAPRCSLTISRVPCRQPDVHDELNRTRREAERKTSRKLWTEEEDNP